MNLQVGFFIWYLVTVLIKRLKGKLLERIEFSGEEVQPIFVTQPVTLNQELEKKLEEAEKERAELKENQRLMKLAFAEMMNNMAEGEENEEEEG